MCTVTVDIDEKTLRDVYPNLSDIAAIREWVQQLIDSRIREMLEEDTETMVKADRKERGESKEKNVYTEKNCVHLSMRKESE